MKTHKINLKNLVVNIAVIGLAGLSSSIGLAQEVTVEMENSSVLLKSDTTLVIKKDITPVSVGANIEPIILENSSVQSEKADNLSLEASKLPYYWEKITSLITDKKQDSVIDKAVLQGSVALEQNQPIVIEENKKVLNEESKAPVITGASSLKYAKLPSVLEIFKSLVDKKSESLLVLEKDIAMEDMSASIRIDELQVLANEPVLPIDSNPILPDTTESVFKMPTLLQSPVVSALPRELTESGLSLEVKNYLYCDKFKSLDKYQIKLLLKNMEETGFKPEDYFTQVNCKSNGYDESVMIPLHHFLADNPAIGHGKLIKMWVYYARERKSPEIFKTILNIKNSKGETFLDYIETLMATNSEINKEDEYSLKQMIYFVCQRGGEYIFYKDKPCVVSSKTLADNAMLSANGDGVTTAVLLASRAGVEANPLGAGMHFLKYPMLMYIKTLPEEDQAHQFATVSATWSAAYANNTCIGVSVLSGLVPGVLVCPTVGALYAYKQWKDTEHERGFWEMCKRWRHENPEIDCIYTKPQESESGTNILKLIADYFKPEKSKMETSNSLTANKSMENNGESNKSFLFNTTGQAQ